MLPLLNLWLGIFERSPCKAKAVLFNGRYPLFSARWRVFQQLYRLLARYINDQHQQQGFVLERLLILHRESTSTYPGDVGYSIYELNRRGIPCLNNNPMQVHRTFVQTTS